MLQSLSDRSIVITRAAHQAESTAAQIEARGGLPLRYPCIATEPPVDSSELDAALLALGSGGFDALVLTSANTVQALAVRTRHLGMSVEGLPRVFVAAVGPATAAAAESWLGRSVDAIAEEHRAESLPALLSPVRGRRILLPQAERARPVLAEQLLHSGANLCAVIAYRTVLGEGGDPVPQYLREGRVDAVLFSSPSTVTNFLLRLAAEGGDSSRLDGVCLASIGPVTTKALQDEGCIVDVAPSDYTLPALLDALADYFRKPS